MAKCFPKLKGRAAEIKHLIPALLHAWSSFHDALDPAHCAIRLALQMSLKMDRILDEHPDTFVLPPNIARDFCGATYVFLNQFTFLANHYNRDGDMIFNLTVKSHMLAHVGLRCSSLNPRRSWCFSGERLMLIIRRIMQSCVRGTNVKDQNQKFMEKYRQALHLTFSGLDRYLDECDLANDAADEADADSLGAFLEL